MLLAIFITSTSFVLFLFLVVHSQRRPLKHLDDQDKSAIQRGFLAEVRRECKTQVTKEADDGWWTSEHVLTIERRAVFAKMPIALAHASMFPRTGSYTTVDHPAGYSLFLILGKDDVLRCFHNVCRHRAHPVISTKQSGCSAVLGCRYHGWSYDLSGKLIKAPKFDGLEGFKKENNSLFEVNVHIDSEGFVFVDVGSKPTLSAQLVGRQVSMCQVESWEDEGSFNWKLAEAKDAFSLPAYTNHQMHQSLLEMLTGRLNVKQSSSHEKPSVLADIIKVPWRKYSLMITVYPRSASSCLVKGILCTTDPAGVSSKTLNFVKNEVSKKISVLENLYSKVYNGNIVPDGAHCSIIAGWLTKHRRVERVAGREVWPALNEVKEAARAESLFQRLELPVEVRGNFVPQGRANPFAW